MLRKPGPATSTERDPVELSQTGRELLRQLARRAFRAVFADFIAMLEPQSPWSRFFGRSTTTTAALAPSSSSGRIRLAAVVRTS